MIRSSRPSTSGNARSTSPLQELIKCFCGICETFFKRKSIEYALKSNGEAILKDEDSRNILKKFISFRKSGSIFKTQLEEIIECFELVQEILNGEKDLLEYRNDLENVCYTEYWVCIMKKIVHSIFS